MDLDLSTITMQLDQWFLGKMNVPDFDRNNIH